MEAKSREQCKIRKRGNSSSSSSSLIHKYRFKRAILVGKRGGSTTPVPIWNTIPKSPSLTMPNSDSTKCPPLTGPKSNHVSVSARKLAASLWEINGLPSPNSDLDHHTQTLKNTQKVPKLLHLSDPSYTPVSQKMDRSRRAVISKKTQLTDNKIGERLDFASNSSLMEIETYTKAKARRGCMRTRLKDVSSGLKASKEILKVLNRIWGVDEQNSSATSLVSALSVELDQARIQVNQLIKEQHSKCNNLEFFVKQFEEEKAAWKRKERERIRRAIECIAEELEVEKKLRKQTERLNKKLGKELADAKESILEVSKELEGEKRAKEILEQVCDELAQGIGEDRAQVEELKRESEKAREEVEKERQMLQLADVLREERVQMKLTEAKYHFEEKNAAVERLRNELEAYFRQRVAGAENGDVKELEACLKEIQKGSCQKTDTKINENEENDDDTDGDDLADSDLHSIELNMDNSSKSYKWSYVNDNDDGDVDNTKRVSVDRDFKGRKSISENIQWRSICLQRRNSQIDDFITKTQQNYGSPTKQWGQTILPLEDNGAVSDSLKSRETRKSRNSTSSRH